MSLHSTFSELMLFQLESIKTISLDELIDDIEQQYSTESEIEHDELFNADQISKRNVAEFISWLNSNLILILYDEIKDGLIELYNITRKDETEHLKIPGRYRTYFNSADEIKAGKIAASIFHFVADHLISEFDAETDFQQITRMQYLEESIFSKGLNNERDLAVANSIIQQKYMNGNLSLVFKEIDGNREIAAGNNETKLFFGLDM